jgi:hypothetical protein
MNKSESKSKCRGVCSVRAAGSKVQHTNNLTLFYIPFDQPRALDLTSAPRGKGKGCNPKGKNRNKKAKNTTHQHKAKEKGKRKRKWRIEK